MSDLSEPKSTPKVLTDPETITTAESAEHYLKDLISNEQTLDATRKPDARIYFESREGMKITHFKFGLLYPEEEDGIEIQDTADTEIQVEKAHSTDALKITYYGESPNEEGAPEVIASAAMYRSRTGEVSFQSRATKHKPAYGDEAEKDFISLTRKFGTAYAAAKSKD